MKNYSGIELVAVNDLYHGLMWDQRNGRVPSVEEIAKRIQGMMAGEKMDKSEWSVHCKLAAIEGLRGEMGLAQLNNLEPMDCLEDREELESLIGSYEYLFKCMDREQAGDTRVS